jgi:cobalamin biosynthesis Mg chelatase CobN
VLALLAFACFPVLAQAEETVYETESTTLPGEVEQTPTHHKNHHQGESSPQANASESPEGGGSGGSSPESSGQNGASQESNPSTPGGGGQDQSKEGNGTGNAKKQPVGSLQTAQPVSNSTQSGDDGSSSPLVPILIAVAVLAAISVGAVLVRQRRGSDGRISPRAS